MDPDSIRVRTEKGRCEILEVSSAVKHSAVAAEAEEGPQAEARKAMEEKRDAVAEKKAELERIKQRDGLVQGYMNKMLTPCNSNPRSVAATSSAGAPPAALPPVLPSVSVEEVAALLV